MKPAVTTQKWEAIKPLTKSINYFFFHNNFPAHGVAAWLSAPCIAALADLLVIKHFVDEAGDPIFPPLAPWSTCSPRIGGSVGEGTRGGGDGGITHTAGAADVRSAGSNRFINLHSKRLCH